MPPTASGTSFHLEMWPWIIAALAAFGIGLSKTGIAGLGILVVAVFASLLPTRASVGIVLPILIAADVIAVTAFRRHVVWHHLWRLFPWAGAGVVLGYFAMGRIDDQQTEKLIGTIVLAMVVIHLVQRHRTRGQTDADAADSSLLRNPWFAASMGILAGFTTMVANAAGPIMILFLLAMRLPKMEFIGTGAWFFLSVNLFKIPFSYQLGLITPAGLNLVLQLAPFAVAGALCGRMLLRHIDQKLFENAALVFTVIAGLRLLFWDLLIARFAAQWAG